MDQDGREVATTFQHLTCTDFERRFVYRGTYLGSILEAEEGRAWCSLKCNQKNKLPPCPAHGVCKRNRQAGGHSPQGVFLGFNGTRHCRHALMALGFNAAAVIQKISLGYYQAPLVPARRCFRENPQAVPWKL